MEPEGEMLSAEVSNSKFEKSSFLKWLTMGVFLPLLPFEPFLKRFPPPMPPWPFPLVVPIPSYLFKNKEFPNFELLVLKLSKRKKRPNVVLSSLAYPGKEPEEQDGRGGMLSIPGTTKNHRTGFVLPVQHHSAFCSVVFSETGGSHNPGGKA